MLRELRDPRGGPNLRVRVLALLVVIDLVVITAPLVVLPLLRAAADLLSP